MMQPAFSLAFSATLGVLMTLTPAALGAEFSQDKNCTFQQFTTRLAHMDAVCCPGSSSSCATALPSNCSIDCAAAFVPMYRDCVHAHSHNYSFQEAGDARCAAN